MYCSSGHPYFRPVSAGVQIVLIGVATPTRWYPLALPVILLIVYHKHDKTGDIKLDDYRNKYITYK